MRERPEITLDNYSDVYEYYKDYDNDGKILGFAYHAFNKILRPRVSFAPGAKEDLDQINTESKPHIYIFNHLSKWDYFIFAATLDQIAPEDIGNIRTMGADFNFRGPKITPSQIQAGPLVDYIGGIPVFRRMDYPDAELHDVQDKLFDCVAHSIISGKKAAAAPEGKINVTNDPTKLLKVHSGVGEVATRAARTLGSDVAITPIGLCYKREKHLTRNKARKTKVFVEKSVLITPEMTANQATELYAESLQRAAMIAYGLYTSRN